MSVLPCADRTPIVAFACGESFRRLKCRVNVSPIASPVKRPGRLGLRRLNSASARRRHLRCSDRRLAPRCACGTDVRAGQPRQISTRIRRSPVTGSMLSISLKPSAPNRKPAAFCWPCRGRADAPAETRQSLQHAIDRRDVALRCARVNPRLTTSSSRNNSSFVLIWSKGSDRHPAERKLDALLDSLERDRRILALSDLLQGIALQSHRQPSRHLQHARDLRLGGGSRCPHRRNPV